MIRRVIARVAAALVSGGAMALLFPPYDIGGLVWVVLMPLMVALWTLKGRRPGWKGFALGWLAGAAFFLPNLHWISVVSPLGWVVVALFLALYFGLWGTFAAKLANPWRLVEVATDESRVARRIREKTSGGVSHWRESWRSLRVAFAVAAVWCLQEWLRGWVFTGFGWNTLGVAFHETPVMAQSADLLGICGLACLPVFLQAVMLQVGLRLWHEARAGRLKPHVDFGVAAVLVALAFCYGVWRLAAVGQGESVRLKALLVQLNIPQEAARRLWTPAEIHLGYEDETTGALAEIHRRDVERFREEMEEGFEMRLGTPDWIVWPESSLTGRILRADDGEWGTWEENLLTLSRISELGEFTMLLGLVELEAESMGPDLVMKPESRLWNSLVVLPPEGGLTTGRKHHLVIFGEYIPFVEKIPWLRKIYEQQAGVEFGGAFSKGESFEPLPVMVGNEEVGVLPSVCFEDTVPRLMRKFVRPGPQLIVNVTNDGWFKESPAAAQHFANSKFRAIELRRPMIRCANTGVSAAVNPAGTTSHPDGGPPQELRDESGNHLTRGWLLAEVDIPKRAMMSLYALIGDWGVVALGVCGLVVGIVGRGRR